MAKITKQIFLRALSGRAIRGRVLRLMKAFDSFEAFMAADKTALMKAERLTRPGGKKGLGNKFFADLDIVKAAAYDAAHAAEPDESKGEARPRPTFTVSQLKAVTALMELCGIERIDLEKIVDFLATMGARI